MPHLVGDVKRIQPFGKKQCGITMSALGERALAKPGNPEQPEPGAADFFEAERTATPVAEDESAFEPNTGLLFGESPSHGREHIHFALAVGGLCESLAEARTIIEAWRQDYSHLRPHSSLGAPTPSEFAVLKQEQTTPPQEGETVTQNPKSKPAIS